jgi:osmotically-inducible protein OsmY
MKKSNWILSLLIAVFSLTAIVSCKNKKAESTTQENKSNDNNNSVEINSDATLRSSVNDVVKAYNGVEADVKDGVVTLRGNIKQDDLQPLIMKVQELKPKKVENQLVIKS